MKLIIRSMLLMKHEKLVLLSKEVKYLLDICSYHIGESSSNDQSIKRDLEYNFEVMEEELNRIHLSKIEFYFKSIRALLGNPTQDDRYLLIWIDTYRKQISGIIGEIELIHQKLSQMFRDGYDQYIPKPIPSRIFSNINITSQVEQALPERLKILSQSDKKRIQIIWDHSTGYKITKYPKEENPSVIFVRMSYWYFDLPYLIPALTHEVGHIATEENAEISRVQKELSLVIEDLVASNRDIAYFLEDKPKFKEKIPDEILADILALLHHGDSYLLTLIHSFLGYYLHSSFKVNNTEKNAEEKNAQVEIAGEWHHIYNRDNVFLRLVTLIDVRDTLKKEKKEEKKLFFINSATDQAIEETKELLGKIYPIYKNSNASNSIQRYFDAWHNYRESYHDMKFVIDSFYQSIKNFSLEHSSFFIKYLNQMNKDRTQDRTNTSKLPQHFNDIWKKRFEQCPKQENDEVQFCLEKNYIPHQSELRKKIHFKTLNQLIKEELVTPQEIQPYNLELIKYKALDLKEDEREELEKNMKSEACEHILGIYDQMQLTKLSSGTPEVSSYKRGIKKYSSKISLLKVLSDIGDEKKNPNETNSISLNLTIQIELNKNIKKRDIYEDLYKDIKEIHKDLNEKKSDFLNVQVFKSLGTKDVVLKIEGVELENLYALKSHFANKFYRTFSIISYKKYNKTNETKIPLGYKLFSVLRVNNKDSIDRVKDMIQKNKQITHADLLTGVMDIRIQWSNETTFEDIPSIYNKFMAENIIADMHTKLTKSLK
jgi:hypothetical protein